MGVQMGRYAPPLLLKLFTMNKVLVWNCRGLGSKKTISYLCDMIKYHKIPLVAPLETRVPSSQAQDILAKTLLTKIKAVEAAGYAGGIWLLWDSTEVNVEVISHHDQILNSLITSGNGQKWFLSIVYTSPKPHIREELWVYGQRLGQLINIPWIIVGYVNQPLEPCDKSRGRPVNTAQAGKLRSMINGC